MTEGKSSSVPQPKVRPYLLALGLSWLGMLAHDLVEFGLPSPQNGLPFFFIVLALAAGWWKMPGRRKLIRILSYGLIFINLLGAITSVLPLSLWPFFPEQSLTHYAVHTLWAASQFPLLRLLITTKALPS